MKTTETLLEAIETGDAAQVQETLDRHPEWKQTLNDPIPGGAFGGTAVLAAVHRRNRSVIDVLLRAGADINARSHWWAGSFGVLDQPTGLEDFLIERGANVDAHAAARMGRFERLKELISADPSLVHARGGDGQTPLHFAATLEIAEFLLAHGADINALDVDHESTPAQYMARERQEVARYLVSRGSHSDLLMAAALGDVDLARKFLDENPSLIRMNVSEEWFPKRNPHAGGTIYIWVLGGRKMAHHLAREFKRDDVLRLLNERTPKELELVLACELGDEERSHELLQQQPDLPAKLTTADHQRLIAAAESSNARAVRLMLETGWPVNVHHADGVTALHWACFHGDAEMARDLLRFNAPLEVEDATHHGKPLGWAVYGSVNGWHRKNADYPAVVTALLDAGAQITNEGHGSNAVEDILRARR